MAEASAHENRTASPEDIEAAARAVAAALAAGNQPYAIVGGGACQLLGSPRVTEDVDFVVPKGATPAARALLRSAPGFTIVPKTLHTVHGDAKVKVEILAPPALFKEPFDGQTATVDIDGCRVLHPVLLLNAKCRSVMTRPSGSKKDKDAFDIGFLLRLCAGQAIRIDADKVPNATAGFVAYSILENWVSADVWRAAGFRDGAWQ